MCACIYSRYSPFHSFGKCVSSIYRCIKLISALENVSLSIFIWWLITSNIFLLDHQRLRFTARVFSQTILISILNLWWRLKGIDMLIGCREHDSYLPALSAADMPMVVGLYKTFPLSLDISITPETFNDNMEY